jgi:iron complex transport system ATP-binding protein
MAALELRAVSAAPWGSPLLHDINLTLATGSVLGILGPNGAGKSTLLHAMAGGVPLTRGELRLGGAALPDWHRLARARAISLLPQNSPLSFPFTVEEVVLLARIPHRTGTDCDRGIAAGVMEATDTLGLRDRTYTELSGGEKQRVQLARAMAQVWRDQDSETRVLLLDEPTSSLDPAHQQLTVQRIRALADSGCAVAVVMHDFNLVAEVADRITVLRAGRQVISGPPDEVLTAEVFRDVFEVAVQVVAHPASGRPLVVFR